MEFPVLQFLSFPLVLSLGTTEEHLAPSSLPSSYQIIIHMGKIALNRLFSRLKSRSQAPHFTYFNP